MTAEAAIKISCGCGARVEIPFDLLIKQRDEMALQFYERHADCREAKLTQARAIESIDKTLHDVAVTLNEFLDMAQEQNA